MSRLNSKENGVIIIVMQRLHQEDLVSEVMDREDWEVLSFPAVAVDDESFSYQSLFGGGRFIRKAGEALHPERDSVEALLLKKQICQETCRRHVCPIPGCFLAPTVLFDFRESVSVFCYPLGGSGCSVNVKGFVCFESRREGIEKRSDIGRIEFRRQKTVQHFARVLRIIRCAS